MDVTIIIKFVGMLSKIIFLLFIGAIAGSTISIGNCAEYSFDLEECKECVSGFYLSEGHCEKNTMKAKVIRVYEQETHTYYSEPLNAETKAMKK